MGRQYLLETIRYHTKPSMPGMSDILLDRWSKTPHILPQIITGYFQGSWLFSAKWW